MISVLIVVSACSACGQKGPPLPPLVLLPAPPVVTAERRGPTVEVGFTVPTANADGSRPANIARIDIFAINDAATGLSDLELIKRGSRVASLPVKSPKNPSDTAEAGEPADIVAPPEGNGLDQGAASTVVEQITASMLKRSTADDSQSERRTPPSAVPLLGPSEAGLVRTYLGVGVDKRGRLGKFSKRVTVPLALAPSPPSQPTITYNETTITVHWSSPASTGSEDEQLLPSKALGSSAAVVAYNVYDSDTGARLTEKPIKALEYEDSRIEWGATRCYALRAVETIGDMTLESELGEPECEELVDTFPPAAPKGLNAVSSEGGINLIWEANTEPDLAGYYVLRGLPDAELERITPKPIPDPSFLDSNLRRGVRYVYAVVAIDKAGNASKPSKPVEETAR